MELLGVEFENVGPFEKQFIPLKKGVNVLVGRNNVGKTALLRALYAISNIPKIESSVLSPYLRHGTNTIGITLLFAAGEDEQFVILEDGATCRHEKSQPRIVKYLLEYSRSSGSVMFNKAEVVSKDTSVTFLEATNSGVCKLQYRLPSSGILSQVVNRIGVGGNGKGVNVGGGLRFELHNIPAELSALKELNALRLISAYRRPTDSLDFATTQKLAADGANLPTYLASLNLNQRKRFRAIEDFIVGVFPEFEAVETPTEGNKVRIRLPLKAGGSVYLANTGSGVEQLLVLAALIEDSPAGSILLLDEPHSFLHPTAERYLVDFLSDQMDKRIVITTHSAVIMNAVPPECLVYIRAPGTPFTPFVSSALVSKPEVLQELGYQNSDLAIEDKLLIGEGPTEAELLPLLFRLAGVPEQHVRDVRFLSLEGVPKDVDAQQAQVRKIERILDTIGRSKIPRLYVFDGDRTTEEAARLQATRSLRNVQQVPVHFLSRPEIENYLLDPEAISFALKEELRALGQQSCPSSDEVRSMIQLCTDRQKSTKGSVILQDVYQKFGGLKYDKRRSGIRIARHLALDKDAKSEIAEIFNKLAMQWSE